MKTQHLEPADVVREHASAYLARYGQATFPQQRRVLRDIVACRTATLGGHLRKSDQCGHMEVLYDSCHNPARRRDRKCQAAARAEWMEAVEPLALGSAPLRLPATAVPARLS